MFRFDFYTKNQIGGKIMAYNKASEERKWRYWKEQEEKKLRELGMGEEKIRELRQMDWEDFLEERRYRERLEGTMVSA